MKCEVVNYIKKMSSVRRKGAVGFSASFLARLLVTSPRNYYIFYLIKYFPGQSIQKMFYLILKADALVLLGLLPPL